MQREVGEMKEWTLNKVFQRLLKAVLWVLERVKRQQGATSNVVSIQEEAKETTHSRQNSPVTGNSQSQRGRTRIRPQTRKHSRGKIEVL